MTRTRKAEQPTVLSDVIKDAQKQAAALPPEFRSHAEMRDRYANTIADQIRSGSRDSMQGYEPQMPL